MHFYPKTVLVLFALAYFISPVDIIPDLVLPYIGWVDDGAVIGTIIYLIRYGRLPNFFFKRKPPFQPDDENPEHPTSSSQKEKAFPGKGINQKPKQKRSFPKPLKKKPHDILNIRPTASKQEIQVAYKEAIKKYHPDKLSHLGEEFSVLANEKFLEIQQAYEEMMNK